MGVTLMDEGILEREGELELVDRLVAAAGGGSGGVLAIEGEPGIGKTRMLEAVRERASDAGLRVLWSRGLELEREFAFGVTWQLFEPLLARSRGVDRDSLLRGPARLALPALELDRPTAHEERPTGPTVNPAFAILHGLYWLTANLSEQAPVLLALDDAHWADEDSLRFLEFLAPRLAELPAVLVLSVRSGEEGAATDPIARLLGHRGVRSISLGPLSEEAVATLVRERLSPDADDDFCRACHEATGGNPFLLGELLPELRTSQITPDAAPTMGVAQLAPKAVSRSVLVRLSRLPVECARVARAVAVLGDDADLARAAALAQLERVPAARSADALVRAHILKAGPALAFKHPLVRAAIDSEFEPAERAEAHARAARLLREQGATPERQATHLLEAWPGGDPETVATLRAAAARTLARGAPAAAAVYLRRALQEPIPESARVAVLGELGGAQIAAGDIAAAIGSLSEALEASEDPRERGPLIVLLARARMLSGRAGGVAEMIAAAITAVEPLDREVALQLEIGLIEIGVLLECDALGEPAFPWAKRRLDRVGVADLDPSTAVARAMRCEVAIIEPAVGESTAGATRDALANALAGGQVLKEQGCESIIFWGSVYVLIRTEAYDIAAAYCDAGLAAARASGSAIGFMLGSSLQSQIAVRRGDVSSAIAAGESAAGAARAYGFAGFPHGPTFLADALIEGGELARAQSVLEDFGLAGELPDITAYWNVLETRGRLRAAQVNLRPAVDDLLALSREFDAPGYRRSFYFFPNAFAAPVLARLGDREHAIRLVREELACARSWGAPGQIGMELRALGLAEGGDRGVDLLREAVETLAGSNRRLEHARALVDLGAALRRAGHRIDARPLLHEGHELARACGAPALQEQARDELQAAGSRPRNVIRTGLDELTPSEHRVAAMAAEGMTNPEIAAALFLTTKTIETHLSHVYRKLEITSRRELPVTLSPKH